jgi:hypothetical protein
MDETPDSSDLPTSTSVKQKSRFSVFQLLYKLGVVVGLAKYSKDLLSALLSWVDSLSAGQTSPPQDQVESWFGLPRDDWFSVSIAGSITTICAVLIAGTSSALILRRIWRNRLRDAPLRKVVTGFWEAARLAIIDAHEAKHFHGLGDVQMCLRALLVLFVSTSALSVILERGIKPDVFGQKWVLASETIHVVLGLAYLVLMAVLYFGWERNKLKALGIEALRQSKEATPLFEQQALEDTVGKVFWRSAIIDLVFVSTLWMTTILPGRAFHLAYILPMMGTWLFLGQRAVWTFAWVVTGLLARTILLASMESFNPDLAKSLGYDAQGLLGLLWEFLPNLIFWFALGLVLAVLRHLRKKPKLDNIAYQQALADANALRQQAADATQDAWNAHKKEARLRRALEILGTQRRHAVFAKDQQRRFIFANEVLLERLAPFARAMGKPLDEKGRARWVDIEGETDNTIGIFHAEYELSDKEILEGRADHFEGYEPAFSDGDPMLWTRKEAIIENGVVTGLVGYVVDGLPVQMQRMSQYLTNELPIYASMKDKDGHIAWANTRHLKKLESRIDELLLDELTSVGKAADFPERKAKPLEAKLKMLGNRRGPTDYQLYGDEGTRYGEMDMAIVLAAKSFVNDPDAFVTSSEMQRIIVDRREKGRDFAVDPYPEVGWMEYHKFPNEEYGRWVEVRKMPWWEEQTVKGVKTRIVKGVLVFFQDNHKMYLRKTVVWRWLDHYFGRVGTASVQLLGTELKGAKGLSQKARLFAEFRVMRLLRRMLLWMKSFVDENTQQYVLSRHPRQLSDFKIICDVISAASSHKVPVRCDVLSETQMTVHGDDLFALLTPLVFNAVEATELDCSDRSSEHPVIVTLSSNEFEILASVKNTGKEISQEMVKRLNNLQALTRVNQPGGGFFLAKRLALHLGHIANEFDPNTPKADLRIEAVKGDRPGALVQIRIPLRAFLIP